MMHSSDENLIVHESIYSQHTMLAYLNSISINFLNRASKTLLKAGDLIGIQFTTIPLAWRLVAPKNAN